MPLPHRPERPDSLAVMRDPEAANKKVVLGKVGRVHGVNGWVRLNSYTAPPENILDYPLLRTELNGTQGTLQIDASRRQPKGLLVHFDGYDRPEVSKALTGKEVWVNSSELPDLESGTFYWHELVGLEVTNLQGDILGTVSGLLETGANDVLVVQPNAQSCDQRERLIPYLIGKVVKQVSLNDVSLTVDWDIDYLS